MHIKYLANLNAFSALTDKPLIRIEPKLPEKPVEKTLITPQRMREIVREAIVNKNKFKQILEGKYYPPILDKIRRTKI